MPKKLPQCEKVAAVKERSQAIGEFLAWAASEKGWELCTMHEHSDDCKDADGFKRCGYSEESFVPVHYTTEKVLCEFFGINWQKWQNELASLLKSLQGKEA